MKVGPKSIRNIRVARVAIRRDYQRPSAFSVETAHRKQLCSEQPAWLHRLFISATIEPEQRLPGVQLAHPVFISRSTGPVGQPQSCRRSLTKVHQPKPFRCPRIALLQATSRGQPDCGPGLEGECWIASPPADNDEPSSNAKRATLGVKMSRM